MALKGLCIVPVLQFCSLLHPLSLLSNSMPLFFYHSLEIPPSLKKEQHTNTTAVAILFLLLLLDKIVKIYFGHNKAVRAE